MSSSDQPTPRPMPLEPQTEVKSQSGEGNRSTVHSVETDQGKPEAMRLRIEPIVRRAKDIERAIVATLPTHAGLKKAAHGVAEAAREAERISKHLKRPFSLHRLPVWFLLISLLLLAVLGYYEFFHVTQLQVAIPDRDAVELRDSLRGSSNLLVKPIEVSGSREGVERLATRSVDLAFVQGGVPIPDSLLRLDLPGGEWLIVMTRHGRSLSQVRRVFTSTEHQGSHSFALQFFDMLGTLDQVTFEHGWSSLTKSPNDYLIPDDIDCVFVVKDLGSVSMLRAIEALERAGFQFTPVRMGAFADSLDYVFPQQIPAGYLRPDPPLPAEPIDAARIKTYLVARQGLTPKLLAMAGHLLDEKVPSIDESSFELDVANTSEVLQGVEAVLSILVYIGLAFLTLLGLEVMTYRRRFNSLNTLVSLISMYQSNKDVLGLRDDEERQNNLLYLSTCSDLLGLIGVIAGYYAQENGSLLYNGLLSVVGERADALRLNIQLKILHASIETMAPVHLEGTSPIEGQ